MPPLQSKIFAFYLLISAYTTLKCVSNTASVNYDVTKTFVMHRNELLKLKLYQKDF